MKILVAGCGYWQVPILQRAKDLGLFVVGMDPNESCEGRNLSDAFYLGDARSSRDIEKTAKAEKVDALITGTDIGSLAAALAAKNLNLTGLPPQTVERVVNKALMRKHLAASHLAPPEYAVTNKSDFIPTFDGPWIVKPTDNCGSRGVSVVEKKEDLVFALRLGIQNSFEKLALVEKFLVGQEFSVEAFVTEQTVKIIAIADKVKSPLPNRYDLELNYPARVPEDISKQIEIYAEKTIRAFEIPFGPVHLEIIYDKQPHLIEMAVRGCGGFVASKLLEPLTGFDYIGAWLSKLTKKEAPTKPRFKKFGKLRFIQGVKGTIKSVLGLDEVKKIPGVIFADIPKSTGYKILSVSDTSSRLGHILMCSETQSELDRLDEKVRQTLKIEISQ